MKSLRLIVLFAALGLGACLWRPPPIPPARSVADSGFATGYTPVDREACDRATEANGGSATISVYVNGRIINCADVADAAPPSPPSDASSDTSIRVDASVDGDDGGDGDAVEPTADATSGD